MHSECSPAVVELADFVGSTTEIMDYAEVGTNRSYITGTENSIVEHLQFRFPRNAYVTI